jgi:hypothetical protein
MNCKQKEKVYISGKISGTDMNEAKKRFAESEAYLRGLGYRTCNPLKMRLCVWLALHCGRFGYVACLLLQLLWMWWTCSCIFLLTDWHTSDGARLERSFARCLGLTALYEQKRKPSPVSKTAEAFAELGKAVAACGVNDKTIKPKSKKQKK